MAKTDNEIMAVKFTKALGWVLATVVFAQTVLRPLLILREPDLFWHIKTGADILASHQWPTFDTYSYTYAGSPWIAKEWLSQILFAASYEAGGWAGPLLLTAFVMGLTALVLYRRCAEFVQPLIAAALVFLLLLMVQGETVARPHIFTFPLAVFFATQVFDAARKAIAPPFWALVLVVLWVNIHGSFPLAFLIAGCAFLDYFQAARMQSPRTLGLWLLFLALCPLMALLNPYGAQPYLIAAGMAQGSNIMTEISEWTPFLAPQNAQTEAGLLAVFAGLLWARARLGLGQILFTLVALHMMLTHLRFIYVFFLFVPVVVLPGMAAGFGKISQSAWASRPRDAIENAVGRMGVTFAALAGLGILGLVGWQGAEGKIQPPAGIAIEDALKYVAQNRATSAALQGHVLNYYGFGGPLIKAGIKTFIDGRAEQLFVGYFFKSYFDSRKPEGAAALNSILETYHITWAILPPDDYRATALARMPEWHQRYADANAVVFEKN